MTYATWCSADAHSLQTPVAAVPLCASLCVRTDEGDCSLRHLSQLVRCARGLLPQPHRCECVEHEPGRLGVGLEPREGDGGEVGEGVEGGGAFLRGDAAAIRATWGETRVSAQERGHVHRGRGVRFPHLQSSDKLDLGEWGELRH